MAGTVHTKEKLFLREEVGKASQEKRAYEMSTSMSRSPIIRSKQTGKFFTLSWSDIIDLAIAAGIDNR
jgi:hypothetical protein